jgi:hypothetical protein
VAVTVTVMAVVVALDVAVAAGNQKSKWFLLRLCWKQQKVRISHKYQLFSDQISIFLLKCIDKVSLTNKTKMTGRRKPALRVIFSFFILESFSVRSVMWLRSVGGEKSRRTRLEYWWARVSWSWRIFSGVFSRIQCSFSVVSVDHQKKNLWTIDFSSEEDAQSWTLSQRKRW